MHTLNTRAHTHTHKHTHTLHTQNKQAFRQAGAEAPLLAAGGAYTAFIPSDTAVYNYSMRQQPLTPPAQPGGASPMEVCVCVCVHLCVCESMCVRVHALH